MSTRSEQRRLRQLEIEMEQLLEDDEALKMTEEQRETLLRPFQSVKFEFYDLDGLSWTDSIRRELLQPKSSPPSMVSQPSRVVFSKEDLASLSPEETIRASAGARLRGSPVLEEEPSYCPTSASDRSVTPVLRRGKRDGTRARSPIKGLFSSSSTSSSPPSSFTSETNNNSHYYYHHQYYGDRDDGDDRGVPTPTPTPTPTQARANTDDYDHHTIKMRDSPLSKRFFQTDPPLPPSSSYPEHTALISVTASRPLTEVGIITSIFRSPVFSPNNGRMRSSPAYAIVASPKSSPSLASVCSLSSP